MPKEETKQLLEEKNIHLWFSGSPVALCTMKLEFDKEAGAIFAYGKMMNVQPEPVQEVVFDLICYDSVRIIIDQIEDCRFSDLDVPRNGVFGMDVPIKIKNQETRNVEFILKSVTTTSGETWENKESLRFSMSLEQESIFNVQGDLHRQFLDNCERDNVDHTNLIFQPVFSDSHWLCACGALNWGDEEYCSSCGISKDWLYENIQKDLLASQEAERKAEAEKIRKEAAEKEQQDRMRQAAAFKQRKEEYEKQQKKQASRKRGRKIALIASIVMILGAGSYAFVFYGLPYINYNNAVVDMNNGNYDQAIEEFESMKGYRDSDELRLKCIYSKAIGLFYARSNQAAANLFATIPGYQDADAKYIEAMIGVADGYLEDEKYAEAYEVYLELGLSKEENENMLKCMDSLYKIAKEQMSSNRLTKARDIYISLGNYKKSEQQAMECLYLLAEKDYSKGSYKDALEKYESLKGYKDVDDILKNLSNLSLVLSASGDDGTPAVWDAYNVKCPTCGGDAQYVCEFYRDGLFKFNVVCDNKSDSEEITGRYKIEGDKLYLSKYVSGILRWMEKGTIKSVENNSSGAEGKNTAIVMTDPINDKNKDTITIYGNKISDSTLSIA